MDSHSVVGRAGLPDSFRTPGPGTFFVTTRNEVGMSCAGPQVTIMPDVTTGVEPDPLAHHLARCALYDIHGRLVASMQGEACWRRVMRNRDLASGVYWVKWQDGASRKVVVLK